MITCARCGYQSDDVSLFVQAHPFYILQRCADVYACGKRQKANAVLRQFI